MFCNLDIENGAHDRIIQINKTCEGVWIIYHKFVELLVITMTLLPLVSVLSNWLIDGDLVVGHFYRPIKTMFVSMRENF